MIVVVDYQKGNLKSVERGLIAAGAQVLVTSDPDKIAKASSVVLPGVGAFADAAATMRQLGQMEAVRQRVLEGAPFLGICLGMHLMFAEGVEHAHDGVLPQGLGLLPGVVDAMPRTDASGKSYKIPHVGWNSVEYAKKTALFDGIDEGEYFYFTHSFIAPNSAATVGQTTHSVTFPSAVSLGDVAFGVQFHPEKSSDAGKVLLRNFVSIAKEG